MSTPPPSAACLEPKGSTRTLCLGPGLSFLADLAGSCTRGRPRCSPRSRWARPRAPQSPRCCLLSTLPASTPRSPRDSRSPTWTTSVFTPKGEVRWLGYWFTPLISTTPHFVKRLAKAQAAFVAVKRLSPPGVGLPPFLCHRLASSLLVFVTGRGPAGRVFTRQTPPLHGAGGVCFG